jgi:DNA-directed RNA polymerase subunit RPC12/RpoP
MKYTCCKCGKEFEDDSQEAQDLFEFYGWIRCIECDCGVFDKMLGVEK